MPANDWPYFVALAMVFFATLLTADDARWRMPILLAASCALYAMGGWLALAVLAGLATTDFAVARALAKARGHRRALLAISITADLGAVFGFKYAGALAPLGIAFFALQSLSYVVDVYRRDVEPASSLREYLTFVAFFPTVSSGPILRARQLLPQLRAYVPVDATTGGTALFLVVTGLVKKIAIADYLGVNFVDRVFDFPARFSSLEVLVAIYAYAIQIYADFSGYSDVAIGSAMLLGIAIPPNFDAPYRARSLPEFWRRWHISLSQWLRDYAFFTIVGRRPRNAALPYIGVMATMLFGGLWHGLGWTFVVWGLLHGAGLVAVRGFAALRGMRNSRRDRDSADLRQRRVGKIPAALRSRLCLIGTFHFVCLTWIFFRAESIAGAFAILRQLASLSVDVSNIAAPVPIVLAAGLLGHALPDGAFDWIRLAFVRLPSYAQALVLFAATAGLYEVTSAGVAPFIYANF